MLGELAWIEGCSSELFLNVGLENQGREYHVQYKLMQDGGQFSCFEKSSGLNKSCAIHNFSINHYQRDICQ